MNSNPINFSEKWDALIDKVEALMHSQPDEILSDNQIFEQAIVAGKLGTYENRTIAGLFTYITGKTLLQYINERRQMYIFERFLNKEKWSSNTERDISCVGETQYVANFKKIFDMTPKDVFNGRYDPEMKKKLKPALYFSQLSDNQKSNMETYIQEDSEEMVYGLKKSDYDKIMVIENIAKHYGLNDFEKNFAYTVASDNSLSYEDTIKYVYDYLWSYIEKGDKSDKRDKYLYSDLGNKEILYLYFNYDYSFDDICLLFNDRLFYYNRNGLWPDNNTIAFDFSYWDKGYEYDRDKYRVFMPADFRKWKKEDCDNLLRAIKSGDWRNFRDLDDFEEYEELEEEVLSNPEQFRNPSRKKLSNNKSNFHGIVQETLDCSSIYRHINN